MREALTRLPVAVGRRVAAMRDMLAVRSGFRHLHGPTRVMLSETEVALVALVRDAAWFLPEFLQHHLDLGVTHVVLIDNGSTDATLTIAQGFDQVTVLRNTLPARRHEVALRVMGAQRVLRGGWFLFADADEMAELPLGRLADLTAYCNAEGYTAVLGQMIDLFSPLPAGQQRDMTYAQAVAACRKWSPGALERIPYHAADRIPFHWFLRDNVCDDPGVTFLQGGVRAEVFGEKPFLSKHSLVRNMGGVAPMTHPHCAGGVRVADLTIALRHYKLSGPWIDRDRKSVAEGHWDHAEDARRLLTARTEAFVIAPADSRDWRGAAALAEAGVLYVSDHARAALS